jgi:hypothetical protein
VEDPQTAEGRFAADLRRTVDRVRGMALHRLGAGFEPEPTRADAVRVVTQRLADLAAEATGDEHRAVPHLTDAAVADQLAVCGNDLRAALAQSSSDRSDAVLLEAADLLLDLRRRI